MTGTANILDDYGTPSKLQNIAYRLSTWVFGHDEAEHISATLVDITESGGAILLAKYNEIPDDFFNMVIYYQDENGETEAIVNAEQRWSDMTYSDSHIKIGFKIEKILSSKKYNFEKLIELAKTQEKLSLNCDLVF